MPETSNRHAATRPDTAETLLLERERRALLISIAARGLLLVIMSPLVWLIGSTLADKVATTALLLAYAGVLGLSWRDVRRGRHQRAGLTGVALDLALLTALPLIWYGALGGFTQPFGLTLKTSITVLSLLQIALSALALRPLYPFLTTLAALAVHAGLVVGAIIDGRTVFTSSYAEAYTTPAVAVGKLVTTGVVLVLVGLLMMSLTNRARRMVIEGVELQRTRSQLERYFSPNLAARLLNNPALLEVGGERRELSFVFTDLEGFTSLVESAQPEVVAPALNGYLDALVRVAFEHDGTVDKIVGDAVHVMFGAPVEQADHATRAVACAVAMHEVAERYRAALPEALPFGRTRIGVNSGEAVVGNFGGENLFDYTAHGNAVNIAARLEAVNKQLGTSVCVSDATAGRVRGMPMRKVGAVTLKGLSHDVSVHEPMAAAAPGSAPLEHYASAFCHLESGDRNAALAAFAALAKAFPGDPLVRLHRERLAGGQAGVGIAFGGE